ncbi:Outer membrane porin protein 32 precursor [compost metagenome]
MNFPSFEGADAGALCFSSRVLRVKRHPLGLALLALAGAASAQSSVTLFGVMDAGVSHFETVSEYRPAFDPRRPAAAVLAAAVPRVTQSQTTLSRGGYRGSSLGFRGTEDLGGGLAASFWLESNIANDDGKTGLASFAKRSTLSLSGGFGELRLGRDYTPIFRNDSLADPFAVQGAGLSVIARVNSASSTLLGGAPAGVAAGDNYARASNSIGYFLPPDLGGFHGQLQYALPENTRYSPDVTPTNARGRYLGGRFGYAKGPLNVALAFGEDNKDRLPSGAAARPPVDAGGEDRLKTVSLSATYDFGPVKLLGELSQLRHRRAQAQPWMQDRTDKYNGYLVGATVPVGPGLVRASFGRVSYKAGATGLPGDTAQGASASQWALGYVHHLSRRTALYATFARVRIRDGQNDKAIGAVTSASDAPYPGYLAASGWRPRSATGYDFGIRHIF